MSGGTRVNQYFQSNNRRGCSALNNEKLDTSIHTPKMRLQNSTNDQLVIQKNHLLQLKQSPSFKLKNHRLSLKQDETKKINNISQTYAKKTRIAVLESLYHQFGTDDEHISLIKNTQQVKLQPIIQTPLSQTTYFGKLNQFNQNQNIEELHFQLVNIQQKYKYWLENFEKKNHSK
ncbi:unnamed protein product [Paramecium sonneborni]|uniref:Uncharacterized protein n=1 Tax=Paramecium sonneborni TaxID=65129 RepID=A0A8S1LRI8_9CILI|nr:unnamed protein product [Paramecium sonneborni]